MPAAEYPRAIRMILTGNSELRQAERKVIDYLAANASDVLQMTVTDVAEGSGTSEATVVRTCKKGGFSGFQQFKIQLAQDIISPVKAIHEEVAVDDELQVIAQKVFQASVLALDDTLTRLDWSSVEQAVELLEGADSVLLCGVGNSGLVALDAEQRWLRLGIDVAAEVAGDTQAVRAALLGPRDVVVAISHSGASRDVVEAVKAAKGNGSKVIAVTRWGKSPLTKLADVVLNTFARETAFRTEAMSSRIAMLAIIDMLFVALSLRRHDEVIENIMRIRAATAEKRL